MTVFCVELPRRIFDLGPTLDPAGGAYDAPQTPSRIWCGDFFSLRFLPLDAEGGVSISAHSE